MMGCSPCQNLSDNIKGEEITQHSIVHIMVSDRKEISQLMWWIPLSALVDSGVTSSSKGSRLVMKGIAIEGIWSCHCVPL